MTWHSAGGRPSIFDVAVVLVTNTIVGSHANTTDNVINVIAHVGLVHASNITPILDIICFIGGFVGCGSFFGGSKNVNDP
jgi:hypothetical protein